ncbi:MAG: hypothetical protein ACO3ZW_06325 [Opitutales bacterium]|jgi:hypothetical protein
MGYFLKQRVLCGLGMFVCLLSAEAGEVNFWPVRVVKQESAVGRADQAVAAGPVFADTMREGTRILSIRPFWTSFESGQTGTTSAHILYPLFNWTDRGDILSANGFNLLQYRRNEASGETFFQLFPFVFINRTQSEDTSYFAVWPIGGVLQNRLFRDRITFAAWPLFVRTQRDDETRTHLPYPFIQMLEGPRSRGFGLWPLYGHFERENDYHHRWALWPFHYHYRDNLDHEVPYVRFGILPFYHRETAEGLKSETFGWPFFGYRRDWEPRVPYSENRYFWPFLVQGRGEEKHINRWLPFYAHEKKPGRESFWYGWPFLKRESFEQLGLSRDRTTLLYFLYRDELQSFQGGQARLTTVWPFAGYWNDGKGRRQLQMLDPLTVFFPRNEKVKENWSPLFALYRFDERMGNRRHSLLWDLVVLERDPEGMKAFYLGPLFEWESGGPWKLLKGLVGSTEKNGERSTRWFWRN